MSRLVCSAYVLALLLLTASAPSAATFYLNPATGADSNPGTQAAPWKTLRKLMASVGPGDTVTIQPGSYTQDQWVPGGGYELWTEAQGRGHPGAPITIQAATPGSVTFNGQQNTYWVYLYSTGAPYYLVFKNLTFQNYRGVALGIGGSYVAVLTCTFENFSPQLTAPIAIGDAHHVIAQGNRMKNIGDPRLGGAPPPDSQHFIYVAENVQHVVIDRNVMEGNSGFGIHFWGHSNFGVTTQQSIVRRNVVVNAWDTTMILAGTNYRNTYVYNNTFYQERVPFPAVNQDMALTMLSWHLGTQLSHTRVVNNIGRGYVQYGAVWSDDNSRFGGDLLLDYNLWQNLAAPAQLYTWSAAAYDQQTFRGALGYEPHSLAVDPRFGDETGRDFTLQPGSPAIDAGTFLTTTVGSGSGTTLPVQDAGYFHDGYGLVAGDVVQLEGGPAAQVTAVDYDRNVLTLATAVTWRAGQGVAQRYTGKAPDMGAKEFGLSSDDDAPLPPVLPAPYDLRLGKIVR
jgi:hypothetical protein